MNRKKLANELTDFRLEYGIFNISCDSKEIKKRIEELFIDQVFVEDLINMMILKSKFQKDKDIDIDKLMELLLELEKLRLELEYKTKGSRSLQC
ncbi:MAG: hypothetical protein FWF08_06730 [Oscillospiraceae bacterium]|nr:hypothetical protein [Oscillospiraceae bacterium]